MDSSVTNLSDNREKKGDPHFDKNLPLHRLVAQLAHDLNLPLASILAYAEELVDLAKERYGMDGFMQIVEYIEIIQSEANHCKDIVDKMLRYAKGLEIQLEIVDLHDLLADCVQELSRRCKEKAITVDTKFWSKPITISTDPTGLRQVITNVLSNACDSIQREGQITIRTEAQKDSVLVEISDNGVGIDKEFLDKIFDPFFTTKDAGKGTGLGLAICQGILQTLNGKITVDSKKAVGTTIKIWLPKRIKAILT
ncbi:HAMP domain-containing histidine kinase [candidate division KSB1 bacterium]|nr:HAMP domain-containing histidine kinase [candidate division KSB1 bacterium]NIR71716.1 HAMP domain-containing histidine kinase [candidate division KSB1 bacterium]NIS28263.1 HAMP domain-containing histidine kinase [candidate division KSB1 bacterium]NIT70393.1 HAMP domain-containing histidine kinase [candidate division KSB1 bacterium]NIU28941.1 HAMP domain-containing histidine kinase [candidate division KSB1 bacterium]